MLKKKTLKKEDIERKKSENYNIISKLDIKKRDCWEKKKLRVKNSKKNNWKGKIIRELSFEGEDIKRKKYGEKKIFK